MIGFMPTIYPDELVYSWFSRYYAHSGYPAYVFALEDLLEKRSIRTDVEFINRLNRDARAVIESMMPIEELILNHTMFPYFRFTNTPRLYNALKSMAVNGEDAFRLLPVQKGHPPMQARHVKYCPACAAEARLSFGEAYWVRKAIIRNINVCAEHKCRLRPTRIVIAGTQSGRLHVAEDEIADIESQTVESELELRFSEYMTEVFQKPIHFENDVAVGEFIMARLEGTKYMSVRGMQKNISLLLDDLTGFYQASNGKDIWNNGITHTHQIQHILSDKSTDFYKICQLAFFLGIAPEELTYPVLPSRTVTVRFDEKVAELHAKGMGYRRIARELGCSPTTARLSRRPKKKKPHDYSAARLGQQKMDWAKCDTDMLPKVKEAVRRIYGNGEVRPGRVTQGGVSRYMGWPDKRLNYLPECRKEVQGFYEEYPVYWAREIVWCYRQLEKEMEPLAISYRKIRNVTNLTRDNFMAALPYLNKFTDEATADRIRGLV